MAVGMLQMLQGVSKQQYDQVNEAMFGQSPPPGSEPQFFEIESLAAPR
jgi:hypothetical protein